MQKPIDKFADLALGQDTETSDFGKLQNYGGCYVCI